MQQERNVAMSEIADAPTVAFSTLGCKVNYGEAEALGRQFVARGYRVVPFEEQADVYVVNTCTVTHAADRTSRGEVRAAARRNLAALVAATGCYVSVANHGLDGVLPGNVLIVTNKEKDGLVERVERERAARGSCTSLALETDLPNLPGGERRGPDLSGGERRGPDLERSWQGKDLERSPVSRPGADPSGSGPLSASALPIPLSASAPTPLRAAATAWTPSALGRTRANLKVQDGCNAGCSFCIIPRARGGPRSVPLQEAVEAARRLEEWGYREIVISGVLLGGYGRDLPDRPRLHDLLAAILAGTRHVRVRLSSVEPQDVDRALFALWCDPRLCRHLHLPLQSGSARILRAMRRQYDADWYAALVRHAVADIPGVAVTIDMMVGFPGEDDELFEESYRLAEGLPLAGMHVFQYSPRRGTAAARLPDQVPEPTKSRRGARMRALAAEQAARFRRAHLGATLPVLWERPHSMLASGLTDNYLRVYSRAEGLEPNTIAPARLVDIHDDGLIGVIV
jgi:threonylcarbamoyladenosine tRNA methylthiotransferase MtaB